MRRPDRLATALLVAAASFTLGAALTDHSVTYARWSDEGSLSVETGAGTWGQDVPEECGDASRYAAVVVGTAGDDVLRGGNRPQVLIGLDGSDRLVAGNAGDCLVGGEGDDLLEGGNGRDTMLGGGGDDDLRGGNGADVVQGGEGSDRCDAGRGPGHLVDCE